MTGEQPIVPVVLDGTDPGSDERHRAALATLPARYVLADNSAGGVAVVASSGEDWVKRAIQYLEAGASAVLITIGGHLDAAGVDAVEQAARSAGAVVAADLEYAADPAWKSVAASASLGEVGLIDALAITSGSLRAAAFRLLVTLAVAVRPLPAFEVLAEAADHLVLGSVDSTAPATLAAVRGADEGGQRFDLISRTVRYEVQWPGRPRAAPTVSYTHTAAGTSRAALRYEAAERGVWQRLHAQLGDGGTDPSLDRLRAAAGTVSFTTQAVSR